MRYNLHEGIFSHPHHFLNIYAFNLLCVLLTYDFNYCIHLLIHLAICVYVLLLACKLHVKFSDFFSVQKDQK